MVWYVTFNTQPRVSFSRRVSAGCQSEGLVPSQILDRPEDQFCPTLTWHRPTLTKDVLSVSWVGWGKVRIRLQLRVWWGMVTIWVLISKVLVLRWRGQGSERVALTQRWWPGTAPGRPCPRSEPSRSSPPPAGSAWRTPLRWCSYSPG